MKNERIAAIRRRELLEVSKALFLERGMDSTTVNDIVDAMGVAKGTFYHYFDSKDSLVEAVLAAEIDSVVEDMRAIIEDSAKSYVNRMSTIMNYLYNSCVRFQITRGIKNSENRAYYEKYILGVCGQKASVFEAFFKEGQDKGYINVRHPNEIIYLAILGVINLARILPTEAEKLTDMEIILQIVEDIFNMPRGCLIKNE